MKEKHLVSGTYDNKVQGNVSNSHLNLLIAAKASV